MLTLDDDVIVIVSRTDLSPTWANASDDQIRAYARQHLITLMLAAFPGVDVCDATLFAQRAQINVLEGPADEDPATIVVPMLEGSVSCLN